LKPIRFHKYVEECLGTIDIFTKSKIAEALALIASGASIGMPLSRPMPSIENGVHELRIRNSAGIFRIFYYVKTPDAILIFHMFQKKTQKTPQKEIRIAQKRLRELL